MVAWTVLGIGVLLALFGYRVGEPRHFAGLPGRSRLQAGPFAELIMVFGLLFALFGAVLSGNVIIVVVSLALAVGVSMLASKTRNFMLANLAAGFFSAVAIAVCLGVFYQSIRSPARYHGDEVPLVGELAGFQMPIMDGVEVRLADEFDLENSGLESEVARLLITAVEPGGPAELAGLKEYDIILQINRVDIQSKDEARMAIPPFGSLEVRVWRDMQCQTLLLDMGDMPTLPDLGQE